MSYRTPLARARGLGSAKDGTTHWVVQRITAVALVPLSLWFVVSILMLMHADYVAVVNWMHAPWNAILLVLLVLTMYWHAYLGLQVVVEDYVHVAWVKVSAIVLLRLLAVVLTAIGIFVVLRIAFGG
ncbi:MAG TPA: succinate dehydrogenase, hydrophobic membrane anchor protein [Gammaproteobacteria bacterium]|nr:succinate dehydrogenase, hydrophobic membrane anchor protein [Gammaproteobacteria bacterium]